MGTTKEPPFQSPDHDHRFETPNWKKAPIAFWKQAFLATQTLWQTATENMPGVDQRDAERAQFQVRQALDLFSSSNHPLPNLGIFQRTLETAERSPRFRQDRGHPAWQEAGDRHRHDHETCAFPRDFSSSCPFVELSQEPEVTTSLGQDPISRTKSPSGRGSREAEPLRHALCAE